MKPAAIGIDLGGTRIKAVLTTVDGKIIQQLIRQTRDDLNAEKGDDREWMKSVA